MKDGDYIHGTPEKREDKIEKLKMTSGGWLGLLCASATGETDLPHRADIGRWPTMWEEGQPFLGASWVRPSKFQNYMRNETCKKKRCAQ